MIKRFSFVLLLAIISVALLYQPALAKKEDTAQIKLKKTAVPAKKLYTYTVKKGDTLSIILRNIPGITEDDLYNNYQIVKELNPDLANPNNLEIGQSLILPGRPATERDDVSSAGKVSSAESKSYRIKRGDTLYKIIRREIEVSRKKIPQTLRSIKAMNPHIRNVNRIYPGTIVKLPGRTVYVPPPEQTPITELDVATFLERPAQPEKIIELKEKQVMPAEARLALLKHVITQMNGTITTTGNYYLPIPKAGQVTIDCTQIPLIEFDDNTMIFLDLENRAHNNLRKMLSNNWKNYFLVKVEKEDDALSILRKVINTTRDYRMTRSEKNLVVGDSPQVEIIVDWIISKSSSKQDAPSAIQGLRMIYDDNLLLPNSVKNFTQSHGIAITEISEETGMVGKPEEIYALQPMPVFPMSTAGDFSYALVSHLGMAAEKDVDVQIFDTVRDGFNLSIKADVLINSNDKKYIIYSQVLSQQFIDALKQAGNETIFVKDNDSPRNIMDNILTSLGIPFNHGNFVFSGLEKNQAPYAVKFNGTKINTNHDLYVIDFDFDHGLRGLLQEIWAAEIAKY